MVKRKKIWTNYLISHYNLSNDELKTVYKKQRKAWICHNIGLSDFYMLHCEDKSMDQIRKYVGWWESSSFCMRMNSPTARNLLSDKWKSYNYFSKFYGRSALLITSSEIDNGKGIEKIKTFVGETNLAYIIKPLNMSSGKGISKLSSLSEIIDYVKSVNKDVIIEEAIDQDESMAAFNQSSVNTLRINTANYGNGVIDVLWPCFRVGRAGSIVDNAGAGGIFAAINVVDGKTIAASDESRNVWKVHPDSKKDLIGFTIPRWKEAVALAKELAKTLPDAGFVGWDFALTKQGWVMVEGNGAPLLIYQIAVGHPIRTEFCEMKEKFLKVRLS